jgi:hypothetical protein
MAVNFYSGSEEHVHKRGELFLEFSGKMQDRFDLENVFTYSEGSLQ